MANYKTVTFTPTLAAELHSALDVLWDTTEVKSVNPHGATPSLLVGVTVMNKADAAIDINLLFLKSSVAIANPGATAALATGSVDQVLGGVNTGTYLDIAAQQVNFTSINPGLVLNTGSTSIWCAGIATATPTPASTSDIIVTLHLVTP